VAEIVLDASAILTFLQGEKGAQTVEDVLPEAVVCSNNLAEIIAKLVDRGVPTDDINKIVAAFDFSVIDVSKEDAVANGLLRAGTREAGLSLGDRSCLALAQRLALPVLTTDRAWGRLADSKVEVRLLR